MKIILLVLAIYFTCTSSANAHVLEELWDKYSYHIEKIDFDTQSPFPGKIIGTNNVCSNKIKSFNHNWEFREFTYEIYYENPVQLAKAIYSLALHAKDIDVTLPVEKFYSGVLGFHYSVKQVCDWINNLLKNKNTFSKEESALIGILLSDNVIRIENGKFTQTGKIEHILGAAPGKKRTFYFNLRHERLHVIWDKDSTFKNKSLKIWSNMTEDDKNKIRMNLKKYNQKNESQIIEEWAIKQAEISAKSIE